MVENERFETRLKTYTGWTAQIIQHEIDHCNEELPELRQAGPCAFLP